MTSNGFQYSESSDPRAFSLLFAISGGGANRKIKQKDHDTKRYVHNLDVGIYTST